MTHLMNETSLVLIIYPNLLKITPHNLESRYEMQYRRFSISFKT